MLNEAFFCHNSKPSIYPNKYQCILSDSSTELNNVCKVARKIPLPKYSIVVFQYPLIHWQSDQVIDIVKKPRLSRMEYVKLLKCTADEY